MNIAENLPEPLNTFVLDVPANEYYDFELPDGSDYPLNGVTYPVDYGHIEGYSSEDGHELDLFVGTNPEGVTGFVLVFRGDDRPNEHKFLVGLTEQEWKAIQEELKPVLIESGTFPDPNGLLDAIKKYKDEG
ncbi:MAG TPA: hypothetical protein VJ836_04585 [Candidatus Saccharimonadales bacterium]|nr:hypothetical protein [Candidatus Saccharimonadales bacterium]